MFVKIAIEFLGESMVCTASVDTVELEVKRVETKVSFSRKLKSHVRIKYTRVLANFANVTGKHN